jgi:hypothetical protein
VAVNGGIAPLPVKAIAGSGTSLFASTNTNGIYRPTDQGQNWAPINMGLTDTNVLRLAVSGSNLFTGMFGSAVFVVQF